MNYLIFSAVLFVTILWMSEKFNVVVNGRLIDYTDIILIILTACMMHLPSLEDTCTVPNTSDMLWATCILLLSEFVKIMYADTVKHTDCWSAAIINAHIFAVVLHSHTSTACNYIQYAGTVTLFSAAILKTKLHTTHATPKTANMANLLY